MTSEATSASDWANFVSTLHKDFAIGSGRSRFARSTVLFATPQHATNESTIYDNLNDDEGSAEKKQEKEKNSPTQSDAHSQTPSQSKAPAKK